MNKFRQLSPLVLSVDGGGTKTTVWLGDTNSGRILGRATSGPSNMNAVGESTALQSLSNGISEAFAQASMPLQSVSVAVLGMAGADRVEEQSKLSKWIVSTGVADHFSITNDVLPLLFATEDSCGWQDSTWTGRIQRSQIALICGTGSIAFALKNSFDIQSQQIPTSADIIRSGGWGYLFSDEGSAFAIGQAALRAITTCVDQRGPATELLEAIRIQLAVDDIRQLIPAVYAAPQPKAVISSLAPIVFATAHQGDVVARRILADASKQLAQLVASVAAQLNAPSGISIALSGSVLVENSEYRDSMLQDVRSGGYEISDVHCIRQPVIGCIRLAAAIRRVRNAASAGSNS
ncbi:MAG: hypothetical protein KDA91_21755 [Planctomycetaceae bacterium]|nr:hypothetical protein [Planctomycetaceae bacterium]